MGVSELMAIAEDILRKSILLRAFTLVSFTVLVFDHLLTLSDEIEYIWKKRMTPFSILFLFNCYLAPSAISAFLALNLFSPLLSGCTIEGSPHRLFIFCVGQGVHWSGESILLGFTMATMLIAEAMITLRVYAVYQNSKLILCLLLPIYITHGCLMGVTSSWGVLFHENLGPPTIVFPMTGGILFIAPAILFDTVAGGFLTLGLYRSSGASGTSRKHMPLVRLIIKDGLLYFAVVFVSNIAWILGHIFMPEDLSVNTIKFALLEIWSGCITTTMIGRLTLNLRKYDPTGNNELTFQSMSLRFRTSHQHTSTITPHQDSNEVS